MNVALSDLVTCPHCGPTYGLILLPYEVRDRRVVSGVLGCANCRERYPVEGGVADLRPPGGGAAPAVEAAEAAEPPTAPEAEEAGAVRLAALLDLAEGEGTVLLAGPGAIHAAGVAALVGDVEVVAAGSAVLGARPGGVSLLRLEGRIPFRSGGLRGVALSGPESALLEEGARAVGPGGRLVVEDAPSDARSRVEAAGLRVLVEEEGVIVATR